jgi:AraC-like DNA-binding protein/mannose-6-phosphate isomerase-like protein (cupin superfamily)
MSSLLQETVFIQNLHATPADWQRDLFYCVVRAGHLRAAPDHRIERETYPGHELILCLKGTGWARIAGKKHLVKPGQLLWVNCHHPHAYGAEARSPWELYWARVEGRTMDRLAKMLQARPQPVIEGFGIEAAKGCFGRIFDTMHASRPSDAAACDAAVSELVALIFEARLSHEEALRPELPAPLLKAIERMRLYYHQPTRVAELAAMAQMSESHFSRMFKAALGTSPIDWLRRERINQAKRRLAESDDAVKEVAQQVGYSDQFFFSKDFKKMTSLTPTEFRRRERQGGLLPEDE